MVSENFQRRLFHRIPDIAKEFGTPFYIYDERGIKNTCRKMNRALGRVSHYRNFFAVKALPNPWILKIVKENGMGFDCSSLPEVEMARRIGAKGDDIMFTSNNTTCKEFEGAMDNGGSIINLDDIIFLNKLPWMPEFISFRYNPGDSREGNEIGKPKEAKYGVRDDLIVEAYRLAKKKGVKRFGLHTMVCSNQLNYQYMVETVKMCLAVAGRLYRELGIKVQFINIGGGFGIPYKPNDKPFAIETFAREAKFEFDMFYRKYGFVIPNFFTECGRYVTGPHGVLVTKVINRPMSKYRKFVGINACMANLMRPGMYGAYHHIYIPGAEGRREETADVIGSLCEGIDKFAIDRKLPMTIEGDFLVIANGGAHASAMGFRYNGRLACAELLLCEDGTVKLIRRAETIKDYFSTMIFPE
jgi:diaminopimelate decarboxylase